MAQSAGLENLYHRRLVAESAGKACWICYKPSSTVLITPDQDDFFYICPGHLTDRKFAIPQDSDDVAEKKRKQELDEEMEALKNEFAEKMRKKLERRKQKEYEEEGNNNNKKKKQEEKKEDEEDEKTQEAKLKELEAKKEPEKAKVVEGPRVFELEKNFWQMRLQRKRDVEVARRNRERLRGLVQGGFPSVPGGDPV